MWRRRNRNHNINYLLKYREGMVLCYISYTTDQEGFISDNHQVLFIFSFAASSLSSNRARDSSCFCAAFILLCLFLLPLPRFGPSIGTGVVMRRLRLAASSACCFSRFLSRFRRVVMELFRIVPYVAWKASSWPSSTCDAVGVHMG